MLAATLAIPVLLLGADVKDALTFRATFDGGTGRTGHRIAEPSPWDPGLGAIRLGVNYVGLTDEVAVFVRALTADEIREVAEGKF